MSTTKKINKEEWQERLQLFTSGNRRRKAAIEVEGITTVKNQALRDVEYDPIGKGNDLIITLGNSENLFTHTVNDPEELVLHQESNGEVSSLEIKDQYGEKTFLRLLNN